MKLPPSPPPDDAFEAGLRIAEALQFAGVSYCLGGALAYGQYGVPRATKDVDVNIFAEPEALGPALEALEAIGATFGKDPIGAAKEEGLVVGHWHGYRLDLFTPSIPFSREAERTRRAFTFDGREAYFLSAEAICVFKLLFFRTKDLADLERLVDVAADSLDTLYVRRAIVEMMGEDDERTKAWDEMTSEG